jgi:predicted secreted Zn-dependent protease
MYSGLANATPVVNEKYIYYDVGSTTKKELINALNSASPIRKNGKVFYGHTDSQINWNFWWNESANACQINKVKVTVDITFTLPRLNNTSKDVSSVWNKWYPKLVEHENGHKNYALEIANQVKLAISELPAHVHCESLEIEANNVGHKLMAELKALNKKYDRNTNHGETEGAWLNSYLK